MTARRGEGGGMTRKDVLPEGAQVEWEETTWTRWTRDGKTAWWGTHYGVYAQIGGTAARIMDEVYHLHAQLAGVREALTTIARCEGRFSRDPLTHASNTIDDMAKVATDALAALEGANG